MGVQQLDGIWSIVRAYFRAGCCVLCLGEDDVIGEQPKLKNIIRGTNVCYKNIYVSYFKFAII